MSPHKQETVVVHCRVLYNSGKAVHIETPLGKEWIPLSWIQESVPELDKLAEGDDATLIIPFWLAREKGLA